MCEVIGLNYVRDETSDFPAVMDLHQIANKNRMTFADEEAKTLLEIVKEVTQTQSYSEIVFESLILQLCYKHAFGRMLSDEEEEELKANPNQVLIDD